MIPSAAAGMSPKQWFALLAFYISYLFFGASVFYHEEHYLETQRRLEAVRQQRIINGESLHDHVLVRRFCTSANDTDDHMPYVV